MKLLIKILTFILVALSAIGAGQKQADRKLYDLNLGKETRMAEAVTQLKQNRIILVGEHHSNKTHHQAQLDVIRALKEAGNQVATARRSSISGLTVISMKKNSSKYITITGVFPGRPIIGSLNMPGKKKSR